MISSIVLILYDSKVKLDFDILFPSVIVLSKCLALINWKELVVLIILDWFFYSTERHQNDVENLTLLNKCKILLSNVRFLTSFQRLSDE